MAYQVLARKYRPQRFADVAGQDHVTVTLMNALTQGRIAHGYIFSGHRGIGKTTIARILAMALNCRNTIGTSTRPTAEPCDVCESCTEIRAGNSVDVIEIDAATNRGIDEIRELRDAARYRPARDKYKIYILDEAHQITDAAFNALLKTLEEPPEHIVFMMATTQPEDIPQTVRSRCQHFSFHAVKLVDILGQIRAIAVQENVEANDETLALLAEAGDGSMRDALSIMDQAIASAPLEDGKPRLEASQVRDLMGTVPNTTFERILAAVDGNRSADVITIANDLLDAGNSPAQLARQCVRYLRNCLIAKIANVEPDSHGTELLQISHDEQRRAARTAQLFSEEELTRFLQIMLRTFDELGYRQEQRFHFELGLLKLVHLRRLLPVEEILSRFPTTGNSGGSSEIARPRPAAAPVSKPATVRASEPNSVLPAKPAFSPFGGGAARSTIAERSGGSDQTPPAPSLLTSTPAKFEPPVETSTVAAVAVEEPADVAPLEIAASIMGVGAVPAEVLDPETPLATVPSIEVSSGEISPQKQSTETSSAEELQRIAVEALAAAKSQGSAADAIGDSEWVIDGNELRVQTALSKTMLSMVVNADADRIIRTALRSAGAGSLKLVLLPGNANSSAEKKSKPVRTGSVQAKALDHPIVQQAQRLFNAEIRNVIDLRDNN
jgi:DNA polymerase III subunit gamma/tau